jgi:parvulin-like peptidyl-prolyl isomerase
MISLAAAIAVTLSGAPPAKSGLPQGYEMLDRVEATVDSKVITRFELERALRPFAVQASAIVDDAEREKWYADKRKQVLDEQINGILLQEEAGKLELRVTPEDVADHLAGIKAENGWDDAQLLAAIQQKGFPTLSAYTEHVEKEMLRTQVLSLRLAPRIRPSQDDVERQFLRETEGGTTFEQVRAWHIQIKVPAIGTPDQLRELAERAERVRELAASGTVPFQELAAQYGEEQAPDGDLGWFGRCEFDPEFERAAFAVPTGEVSKVVQTLFGFQIIRIAERRRVPLPDAQRVKRCIRISLELDNRMAAYDGFMKELRLSHHVEVK